MSEPASARILIADDQIDVLEALRLLLKPEGYAIETATSAHGVLQAIEKREFEVLLVDMNYTRDTTSGREGLDLVSRIVDIDPTLPVVVMTAWGSVEGAVEAMRRGARDYVEKPWDNTRLLALLSTHVELGRALRRARRLEDENRLLRSAGLPALIAESAVMGPVLRVMERVAPSDANVLITGEHGTGKEVIAAHLHARSARSDQPLITVNAGRVVRDAVRERAVRARQGRLHRRPQADRVGRFELADGGTLFLDEIANVSLGASRPSCCGFFRTADLRAARRPGARKVGRRADPRRDDRWTCVKRLAVAERNFREDLYLPAEHRRDADRDAGAPGSTRRTFLLSWNTCS